MTTCASILAAVLSAWNSVSWHEWAKILFDLIKGVSWPLAAFGIVFIFRHQIRERFPDLISLGTGGAVLQARQQTASAPTTPLATLPHELPSVNALVDVIRIELEQIAVPFREQRLIGALAEARLLTNFEFIFGLIFGTQIKFLALLKDGPMTVTEVTQFFKNDVIPVNKEFETLGVDKWLWFLTEQALVVAEANTISITTKGRDFLSFVSRQKDDLVRPN